MSADYNMISERERGIWHGVAMGLVAGVVLTLWCIYGGM